VDVPSTAGYINVAVAILISLTAIATAIFSRRSSRRVDALESRISELEQDPDEG